MFLPENNEQKSKREVCMYQPGGVVGTTGKKD